MMVMQISGLQDSKHDLERTILLLRSLAAYLIVLVRFAVILYVAPVSDTRNSNLEGEGKGRDGEAKIGEFSKYPPETKNFKRRI